MSSHRIPKINSTIARVLGTLLTREVRFKPGVLVTISKVDTARDFAETRVSISVFPENEAHYVTQTLHHECGRLQKALHKALPMRTPPKLRFLYDNTAVRADAVEKILKELSDERS